MKDIFLTGPKHSGKTSVGKVLAGLYSSNFIDLDELIEELNGQSPRKLYTRGAEIFRSAETAALEFIIKAGAGTDPTGRVIATGGGLADNQPALDLLAKTENAFLVYLDVSTDTAWHRIAKKGKLPPFLQTENPRETHRALHEKRASVYKSIASLVINAEGKSPAEIAVDIFEKIGAID